MVGSLNLVIQGVNLEKLLHRLCDASKVVSVVQPEAKKHRPDKSTHILSLLLLACPSRDTTGVRSHRQEIMLPL